MPKNLPYTAFSPTQLVEHGGGFNRAIQRAQEQTALASQAKVGGAAVSPTAAAQPGAENVSEALRVKEKQAAAAAERAGRVAARKESASRPKPTKPREVPSPAQTKARQKVDVGRSDASARGDIRGFVRPAQGSGVGASFQRNSARLGAFDPRQRTAGQIQSATDALNMPGQPLDVSAPVAVQAPTPSNTLPSSGFNAKQFEEDQRLLGAATE
jgi:hypothetical protein